MELTGQLTLLSCQNSKEHVDHIVPGASNMQFLEMLKMNWLVWDTVDVLVDAIGVKLPFVPSPSQYSACSPLLSCGFNLWCKRSSFFISMFSHQVKGVSSEQWAIVEFLQRCSPPEIFQFAAETPPPYMQMLPPKIHDSSELLFHVYCLCWVHKKKTDKHLYGGKESLGEKGWGSEGWIQTKDIFVCVLAIIGTKAMVRTMKTELQEILKKWITKFLDLLCQRHPEISFGSRNGCLGFGSTLFKEGVSKFCKSLFGTSCRNKSCF